SQLLVFQSRGTEISSMLSTRRDSRKRAGQRGDSFPKGQTRREVGTQSHGSSDGLESRATEGRPKWPTGQMVVVRNTGGPPCLQQGISFAFVRVSTGNSALSSLPFWSSSSSRSVRRSLLR